MRVGSIPTEKLVGQSVPADLRKRAGQFDSGWAAANNHKVQWHSRFSARGLAFRQFEGQQYTAPYFEGVFNRLQARSENFPVVMSKVGVSLRRRPQSGSRRGSVPSTVMTSRRSRSNSRSTSLMRTSTFLWERRIERIGAAISPGESPAVAT